MTVKEAFEQVGIKNLKPKYKKVMDHDRYGEILSTDKHFPQPILHFDWLNHPEKHEGDTAFQNAMKWSQNVDALLFNDQSLHGKMLRRTEGEFRESWPGTRTGIHFIKANLAFGLREPGWNGEDPRIYYIIEDFIRTFWGQETLDRMAEDWKIDDWRIREGGVIATYFNPETRLVIVDGAFEGIPLTMFVAPTDIPNTI